VPDGPPVVHLEGFGLEDTHSVVNSLRWGPDGWLYAAQGSTVSAQVRVVAPGARGTNVSFSQGQNIWRYHPERHIYEVFAEGGGNAFGVELDNAGRIFSGHNGGDTRGFHYDQGAYLRKGFEKHGELSNPYAFGYFPQMDGTKGERFSHTFLIYHGGALPAGYDGKLFGVEPLQGRVVMSELNAVGTTFSTRDLARVVTSSDSWFRPVDIKPGPDGAIYIADWYDRQVTHTRNQEGNIDASNGRIYRLKRKGGAAAGAVQPRAPLHERTGRAAAARQPVVSPDGAASLGRPPRSFRRAAIEGDAGTTRRSDGDRSIVGPSGQRRIHRRDRAPGPRASESTRSHLGRAFVGRRAPRDAGRGRATYLAGRGEIVARGSRAARLHRRAVARGGGAADPSAVVATR
jgi:hypothetical protein